MAIQTLAGHSVGWHAYPFLGTVPPAFSSITIDLTGEKVAFSGRVCFPGRTGTKDIRKVGFRFGAVTKAGGSGLTVSLQNVLNAGAGAPMRPDETQDQTVAIANGDAGFATNTWCQTGALSADRTVAFGDLVSVVIEFDGSGRLGSDSVAISGIAAVDNTHGVSTCLKASGTWTIQTSMPNVILEFSDGTFGTLLGAFPCSAISSITFNSGSAADEVALEMTWPGPVKIDGVGACCQPAADFDFVVYDGTSAMTDGTVTVDSDFAAGGANRWGYAQLPGMVSLAKDTTYRIAVKPTSVSNVVLFYFDVHAAGHLQAHLGGQAWAYTTRVDAGSWAAATATRRPFLWPYVCAIDDGVGGGGGGGPLVGGRLVR